MYWLILPSLPACVVIVIRVNEAAGLQLTAHHGRRAVVARRVLAVPVQFWMAVDPRDCTNKIKGLLLGKEEAQGRNGTVSSTTSTSTARTTPQEILYAKTKLFAGRDFI